MGVLPKYKWDVKVTSIREAKDLTRMSFHELVGNLKTYEMNLEDFKNEKVVNEKSLSLKESDSEESKLEE